MPLTPEKIEEMRNDYAAGLPVAAILAKYVIRQSVLYHWLDGGPVSEGIPSLPPLPRRGRLGAGKAKSLTERADGDTPPSREGRRHGRFKLRGGREQVIARLWRAAEAQVREIENRIQEATRKPVERERDARVLAIVTRALRDLSAFDDARSPARNEVDVADDEGPRDLDEFRRELARRIESFIEARTGAGVSGDGDGRVDPSV